MSFLYIYNEKMSENFHFTAEDRRNCRHAEIRTSRWFLTEKTALVTGGTHEIGHAIVEELAELGAAVYTCSWNEAELNNRLSVWRSKGYSVHGSACDASSRTQRHDLIQKVSAVFGGKLNILAIELGTKQPKDLRYMAVVIILLLLVSSLVVLISHWVHTWRRNNHKKISHGKLPPGSMGFPFIGETLEFFVAHGFHEIHPFITKRIARYGPLFKTNLVGLPLIVSTDSEFNHYIFQQEGKLFRMEYPQSFIELFGKDDSFMTYHGIIHKYLKNLILNFVSRQRLKDQLLHEIDGAIRKTLASWTHRQNVNLTEAVPDMLFEYFAFKLISYDESTEKKKLRSNFKHFIDGLISFPLNIPGTSYHACWKGRKNAMKMIEETYQERKASNVQRNDFLDVVIEETEKENAYLNEASAINLLFILLFAGHETTSQAIILIIKFITENPSVLTKLTEEQVAILKGRGHIKKDAAITWEEYKSMSFTHMVINETLRIANIAPIMFRRVIQDIEANGYNIPAGWLVVMFPGATHMNSCNYEDPFKFNPWRWEGQGQEVHAASKNFMAFGGGLRNCVGSDFAKVQMAIFIHHFVTNYSWKIIRGGKVIRKPGLQFPDGLHVKIWNVTDDPAGYLR